MIKSDMYDVGCREKGEREDDDERTRFKKKVTARFFLVQRMLGGKKTHSFLEIRREETETRGDVTAHRRSITRQANLSASHSLDAEGGSTVFFLGEEESEEGWTWELDLDFAISPFRSWILLMS